MRCFNSNILNTIGKVFSLLLLMTLCLTLFSSCSSKRIIVNDLDEKEANEILVFLASKGVDSSKVQAPSTGGGAQKEVFWNIQVDETQANEAMALLNAQGLPRRKGQNLLNIFSSSGLVPSDMNEKIRYQSGKAAELASIIRNFTGVLDAEVQLSIPEEDPLNPNAPQKKITASVYVKHNGVLDDPNSHLASRIKNLVAGAIPGLSPENVSVIGDLARINLNPSQGASNISEKQLATVWSVVLTKDSVNRFQIIFFTFLVLILLLLLGLVWIGWKTYPLIEQAGGVKQLLTFHPLHIGDKGKAEKTEPVAEQKVETPPTEEESAEKDVDVT